MTKIATHHLPKLLNRLKGARVCIVGDCMLDEYLVGDAERISPEAPVPIVLAEEEHRVLGGAGNVARNIRMLEGRPLLISVCGRDGRADMLREELEREQIDYHLSGDPERPTTLKTRVIARNQQVLRIDREDRRPVGAAIRKNVLDCLRKTLEQEPFEVLILSDYGKGLISGDFMAELAAVLAALPRSCKVLVDPKTPNFPLYTNAFLMTPNRKETHEASGLPVESRDELLAAGRKVFADLACQHLLTTLGPNGMALFLDPATVVHIPSAARRVFDVTGAGDTVIAVVAQCLAAGLSLLDSCLIANQAAGLVVGQVGAATVTPEELREAVLASESLELEYWARSEKGR